ncbi:Retrovirus-related Pol polyprotein from transposon RE2 [Sesamum angolense]|uniref:Retrovirus-related Pol polyprotein from transposon RE2 n=1 Tax=Sesamum angolense TaxID=2727404 RepID=A0AAE1WXD5_9LAMI|nr:Retrovirus-related Pol polyprotein from transposon RE2 [Sesamum angolense]
MVLVSAPLTGNNYLNWSFGVKRALRAKMKLGFIDGTSIKPNANHPHFEQWIRVDSMVTTWILNSISKDIVEAFMYTKSSRNLWLDLEQRYGECNGPQLYQLQREICSMTQSVRHQLLVMDPVPSINKAYAMVQSVEKQRQVHMELSESTESAALHVRGGNKFDKRKFTTDKRPQYCVHCDRAGHSKETCFKIHGTPDWYKELQDKRRRDTIPARGFTVDANPMKEVHSETKGELLQELIRLMKTGFHMDSPQGNFAQSDDFAGMNGVFAGYGNNILTSWIVDTGATNHMCASACILTNVSPLPNPTSVHLPDGNTQLGHPSSIVLQHIPEIKHLTETQPNDCCICPLAKQHRRLHSSYMDFLLKHKSQVHHTLATFFTMVNTQFHTSIKVVRSDNGSEFVNAQYPPIPFSNSLHPFPVTQPAVPTSSDTHIPLRRSQRTTSKPSWLNDYECNCISSNVDSCIPSSYSAAHLSFVAHLSSLQEPKDYLQASKDSNWVAAMNKELEALKANDTWILTSLPPGKQTIGSRWVFKLKLNPDGSVERYKARLVAKGYNQIEGVDYFDSFSPVAKSVTVRIFLALAVSRSWPLLQFDVNNAFLHGSLDEDVYMEPPQGFVGAAPGQVCKLQKSLYGLKQASRQWNLELTTKLLDFGFSQSTHEHCLFIKSSDSEFTALLVYVDDILLTGNSESALHAVRDYLDDLFTIKDLGQAKYFLGLELARSSHGLQVSQHKYLQDILADTSMLAAKPASTPFPLGLKLVLEDGALLPNPNKYRRLIGRLLYLGFTRPDISFAVQQLSQFLQAPRTSHWDAALHVLRYLKGTPSTGLFFSSSSSSQLTAYSDASWASCLDSRRSITGYCIFLGTSLVSWKTKKQATVSRSSAEAEYRSMASTVCELLWITYLLRDFGVSVSLPIHFWCDNQAALHITANPVFHERTKHLDIDCHLVRDQFKLGFIALPTFQTLLNLLISSQNRFLLVTLSVFCPRWACSPTSHLEGGL